MPELRKMPPDLAVLDPCPVRNCRSPVLVDVAEPVLIVISPDSPPLLPLLAVMREMSPEDVACPDPLVTTTLPPVAVEEAPPMMT